MPYGVSAKVEMRHCMWCPSKILGRTEHGLVMDMRLWIQHDSCLGVRRKYSSTECMALKVTQQMRASCLYLPAHGLKDVIFHVGPCSHSSCSFSSRSIATFRLRSTCPCL